MLINVKLSKVVQQFHKRVQCTNELTHIPTTIAVVPCAFAVVPCARFPYFHLYNTVNVLFYIFLPKVPLN